MKTTFPKGSGVTHPTALTLNAQRPAATKPAVAAPPADRLEAAPIARALVIDPALRVDLAMRARGEPPRLGLIETGTTDEQLAHFNDVFPDGFGEQQLVEFERRADGTYSLQKLRYQGGSDGEPVIISAEKMKELWVADRGVSG